jgi:hypothetical protein
LGQVEKQSIISTGHIIGNEAPPASFLQSRQEEEAAGVPSRLPGLPRNPPLPQTVNITNVVTLLELAANDEEIDDGTEALLVQTLSELATFVGLQDTRDFLGMFFMYFVLGPILVPLYWLPISLLAMGFLMIPLVYKAPIAAAAAAGKRQSVPGDTSSSRESPIRDSQCLEMISCEFHNALKGTTISSWIER